MKICRVQSELIQKYQDQPEQLQQEAKKALVQFHAILEKGHSRRTMSALQELVQDSMETIPLHSIVPNN